MDSGTTKLGEVFDRSPNALNFVRLLLAAEVLLYHSAVLRNEVDLTDSQWAFFRDVGVDGFFAVSGFLIVRSWVRRPQLGAFLIARARRILPGFWVCLAVTALVIAPVACLLAGDATQTLGERMRFVTGNFWLQIHEWDIGASGPANGQGWNGSLWTLQWEAYCYLAVAALGVSRLLRPRVVVAAAVVTWSAGVVFDVIDVVPSPQTIALWMPFRAGLMFSCGALLWIHRDKVTLSAKLAGAAAATIAAGVLLVDDYRTLGAPAVAYLCIFAGVRLGRFPRLVLRHDLSYGVYVYAFPLQQTLVLIGVGGLGWLGFSALSAALVLPFAAASWFLVERPVLRRRTQAVPRQEPVPAA